MHAQLRLAVVIRRRTSRQSLPTYPIIPQITIFLWVYFLASPRLLGYAASGLGRFYAAFTHNRAWAIQSLDIGTQCFISRAQSTQRSA